MKKQELEKKIGTAIENATPNKLDSIMNACDTQKKTTIIEMPKQKKGGWKKVLKATSAVAAVLILVLCLSVILNPGTKSSAESVILLDVNPSFSIKIDAEENVVSINAQNEDAAKILGTTRGLPASEAAEKSLEESGLLEGLSHENDVLLENLDTITISPYMELAQMKGFYNTAIEKISYGAVDTATAAHEMYISIKEYLERMRR